MAAAANMNHLNQAQNRPQDDFAQLFLENALHPTAQVVAALAVPIVLEEARSAVALVHS